MADQRNTFTVAGRINQLEAPYEAALDYGGRPLIKILLANSMGGSTAAWRIPQR